jgi:hypothetical protein
VVQLLVKCSCTALPAQACKQALQHSVAELATPPAALGSHIHYELLLSSVVGHVSCRVSQGPNTRQNVKPDVDYIAMFEGGYQQPTSDGLLVSTSSPSERVSRQALLCP